MKTTLHRPFIPCSGLTLLELLVVLSILAVLSTVALTSSSGLADQARYEATQRTLENIREAIIGQPNMMDTDGTPLRSGFVADIGRLPRAFAEILPSGETVFTLEELLNNSTGMQPYSVLAATTANITVPSGKVVADEQDPDVLLGTGWRGPYLKLKPGNLVVRDGWGVEFVNPSGVVAGYTNNHLKSLTGAAVASSEEIAQFISFGNDDAPGGNSGTYDADVDEVIQATDYQATQITVPVTVRSSGGHLPVPGTVKVAVRYFAPNGDDGGLFVSTKELSSVTVTDVSTLTFTVSFSVNEPAGTPMPTVGPRALRAYLHATEDPTHANTTGTPTPPDAPTPIFGRSAVAYLTLRPGANVRSLFINLP